MSVSRRSVKPSCLASLCWICCCAMRKLVHSLIAVLIVILTATPFLAHHEITAKFDPSKPSMLTGTVSGVDWRNPHVHVFLSVRDGDRTANWFVELESQLDL